MVRVCRPHPPEGAGKLEAPSRIAATAVGFGFPRQWVSEYGKD